MDLLRLVVGFILFVLGLGYLFKPGLIMQMNAFFREHFFKDSVVLLNPRRIGITLLFLGFILIALSLVGR